MELKDWIWREQGNLLQKAYDELIDEFKEEIRQSKEQVIDLEIKKNKAEIMHHIGKLDVDNKNSEIQQYTSKQYELWQQIQCKEEIIKELETYYSNELIEKVKHPTIEELLREQRKIEEEIKLLEKQLQENNT